MSADASKIIRKNLKISGFVQGVGFRYRAAYAAKLVGATGWVQNNYDDSVTLEIQATEAQITQVLMLIKQGRYIAIDNIEAKMLPLVEDERSFSIR